jgi:hypothetical protein
MCLFGFKFNSPLETITVFLVSHASKWVKNQEMRTIFICANISTSLFAIGIIWVLHLILLDATPAFAAEVLFQIGCCLMIFNNFLSMRILYFYHVLDERISLKKMYFQAAFFVVLYLVCITGVVLHDFAQIRSDTIESVPAKLI